MATSGSYNLDLTFNDILQEAYELLQAVGSGEDLSGTLTTQALNSLNSLLKAWEAQGIHLWTQEEYTLFLVKGQAVYDFRLAATRLVNEFQSTALSADEAIGQTVLGVTSSANMVLGQPIGVIDENNELFWSIIEAIPDATSVTLKDALTVAAASGAIVRHYSPTDPVNTTLAAGAVATDTTVELATVVGMSVDNIIGITDDTGAVLWTTIQAIDTDTNIVTLNDAITATSSIGVDVITYKSTQNFIPVSRITSVRRHAGENSDYEIPIVNGSRADYFDLPNKDQSGTPIQSYYSRQEPQGVMYLWNAPSSAVDYINFTAERQMQIMSGDGNETFDLPSEWFDALTYQLAKR